MNNIISIIKNNKYKFIFGAIIIAASVYYYGSYKASQNKDQVYTSPKLESITETVEVSGPVKPSSEADLAFEKSGNVSGLYVKVGDKVRAGQQIATLSAADAYAAVNEARAALDAQQANLELIQNGSSNEEVAIRQQALDNAKSDLANTESQVSDTISNTYNNISDLLTYKMSTLFSRGSNAYNLTSPACNQAAQSILESDRMNLDTLVSNLNSISVSSDSSESKLSNAYSITQKLNDFLKSLSNYYSELCVTSDPNYNDERGAISAMKPILSSVVAEINAKKSALLAGANAVSRAERDLNLVNASTDNNKVKSAQSAVTQAKARLSSAQAQASKNSLYAPFAGVITKVDIVKGELASVGKPIVTMMSENNFEIEVKLSEVDVVKVKVGQEAVVTLDAYGADVKFPAVVTRMDPAATADNGVSTYKATLAFKEKDDMIKSGMNATVEIETMKKDSALTLPVSLVNFKVGGAIVTVKTSTSTEDRIVKTGARSNGKVEIVEGLTINDQVLEIAK